jgi:hypothetical protein
MTDLDRRIRARVDAFVVEISELVRRAAVEAVADALGAEKPSATKPARTKRRVTGPAGPRSRGGKRTPKELEKLAERVLSFVSDNPGSGASEIASGIGVGTKDLVLPMKKLTAAGSVTSKGQKRATKYFRGKK